MSEHKVMGGYSQSLDRYYHLYAGIDADGRVCLREEYEYPDRPGLEGREYGFRLWIAAEHVDAWLARLAREGQLEPDSSSADAEASLVTLLARLVKQGRLASAEAVRAQENLDTFKSWLAQEGIPYESDSWVW